MEIASPTEHDRTYKIKSQDKRPLCKKTTSLKSMTLIPVGRAISLSRIIIPRSQFI